MVKIITSCFILLLTLSVTKAQSIETLREKITTVIENKSATVGVAIQGSNSNDSMSINGHQHLPMQSVFKYHLALAVLHQVDKGKLRLNKKIVIRKKDIQAYSHLWSPLRKKYPNGARVSIAELLQYTVALSDNLGCDILFKLIGGTSVVQSFLHKIGIKDIAIHHNEMVMQSEWEKQYDNWTTAKAANQVLELFFENKNNLLSAQSHRFLLETLKGTKTGKKSIRGLLPQATIVAHKTGHSGKNKDGLTGALNDIGIVFLSDNSYFYISILVSDSMEEDSVNQQIIAEIAKLTWDYFNQP